MSIESSSSWPNDAPQMWLLCKFVSLIDASGMGIQTKAGYSDGAILDCSSIRLEALSCNSFGRCRSCRILPSYMHDCVGVTPLLANCWKSG